MTTHNGAVTIAVNQPGVALEPEGLDTIAIFAEDQVFGTGSGSYLEFDTYADAVLVGPSGTAQIDATTLDYVQAAFAQNPQPRKVFVVDIDAAGGDGPDDALAAALLQPIDFYGVILALRGTGSEADVVLMSDAVEALGSDNPHFFVWQTGDTANTLDGTLDGGGLSTIETNTRTALVFHDTDTEYADAAWLAGRLAYGPDTQTAGFAGELKGVASYATTITAGQKTQAEDNNVNVILPFGPRDTYILEAEALDGEPVLDTYIADWLVTRTRAAVINAKLEADDLGVLIPVAPEGQEIMRSVIQPILDEGVVLGKLIPRDADETDDGKILPRVEFPAITAADVTARRIRATVTAENAQNAKQFTIDINLEF